MAVKWVCEMAVKCFDNDKSGMTNLAIYGIKKAS